VSLGTFNLDQPVILLGGPLEAFNVAGGPFGTWAVL
jgi:hypothetical protein